MFRGDARRTVHFLSFCILLSCATTAASSPLTKSQIISLYEKVLVADGHDPVDLSEAEVVWKEGSFTSAGAVEAVASVTAVGSFYHAEGYAHVLFFRYSGGWTLVRELAVGDMAGLTLVDVEGDGRKEVWIETNGGNMGEMYPSGSLLSLSLTNDKELFSYAGQNTRATSLDRTEMDEHSVQFTDLDRDGVLEIVDTEEIGTYANRGDTEVELSHRVIKTYWKYRNGVYVKYEPGAAPPAPKPSPGGDDPVPFAIEQMKKTDVVWTPVFYASTWGVYKIGGRIAMAGGAYILLESPSLAVDLVLGGIQKAGVSIGKDFALELIESAVKTPRKVCLGVTKSVIDAGWEEYKIAYEIAKKYKNEKALSRSDALRFLRYRFGPNKMAAARVLYEQTGTREYKTVDQQMADKTAKALVGLFEKSYLKKLGVDQKLPVADSAYFIKDVAGILSDARQGLMSYQPYVDFVGKMDSINRALLDEARRFGNAPATSTLTPPASIAAPPPSAAESFSDFFARFKSDKAFQLSRIVFPLKHEMHYPGSDVSVDEVSYSEKGTWEFERFAASGNQIWKGPDVKGDAAEIEYQEEGTGISVAYCFKRVGGKWYLEKIEDWSA